jgi:hypothetical protein
MDKWHRPGADTNRFAIPDQNVETRAGMTASAESHPWTLPTSRIATAQVSSLKPFSDAGLGSDISSPMAATEEES